MEDVGPLVIPGGHGPEVLEPVDRPLDFIAALVERGVEAGWPAAFAAAASAGGPLVLRLRDGVLDLPSSQVPAIAAGGVGLVAPEVVRPGAWTTAPETGDTDAFEDRNELRGVAPLARCDQQGQGAASAFTGEVDLAGQPAPGPSESLVEAVLPGR